MMALPDGPHGLIGSTGFVGGNIARQHNFDVEFHSANVDALAGREFTLLVCAAPSGAKWRVNANPRPDLESTERLIKAIGGVRARRFVLISTVDVFANPIAVDESTSPDTDDLHAYGQHRRALEQFVQDRFDALIIRLPGLYGTGLKKNVIFDLLHGNEIQNVDARSRYQFYPLTRIWSDIRIAISHDLSLVHLPTEPVSVRDLAATAFGLDFSGHTNRRPAEYDMWTRFADLFGGRGHYVESRAQVLTGVAGFVTDERRSTPQKHGSS